MHPVRILLVDDSPEFLDSAAGFLSANPQLDIVGRALSGHEALDQVGMLCPDLVLMDISMPGINGIEATRSLKTLRAATRVIILTMHDNAEYRAAAALAKADGFIMKSEFGTQLLPLISSLFSPECAQDGEDENSCLGAL
jgi:DNA-binding NarL/FixJ family response regulator